MTSSETLPADWTVETEQTIHDEIMGRDYTSVIYRQEDTRSAVFINEVISGENVWKYSVHHSGGGGDLGTTEDLEAAKEIAVGFINESVASA